MCGNLCCIIPFIAGLGHYKKEKYCQQPTKANCNGHTGKPIKVTVGPDGTKTFTKGGSRNAQGGGGGKSFFSLFVDFLANMLSTFYGR